MTDTNTRADWRTLPAGRALDLLIAERIGLVHPGSIPLAAIQDKAIPDSEGGTFTVGAWRTRDLGEIIPAFSTSDDAALEMVLASFTTGWRITIVNLASSVWRCSIHNLQAECGIGEADTPALAICRAWLAWSDAHAT